MNLDMLTQRGIGLLQLHAPADGSPYFGAFSGGKDSVVIKELARLAGVPVVWHYHVTTIDPPELLAFIKRHHPDVVWDRNPHGFMLARALRKGFPTKRSRWCCSEYKETTTAPGSTTIIGVRVAESTRRKSQWTTCTTFRHERHEKSTGGNPRKLVLPIRLWSDDQVWEFIRSRKVPYCSLYDEGWKRLGCVGCPLVHPPIRAREFARWPRYEAAWRRMFERLWAAKAGTTDRNGNEWWGSRVHDDAEELWEWWNAGQFNATEWRQAKGLRIKG